MDETKLKQFVTLLAQSTMEQKMKDAIMSNLEALSVEEFSTLLLALQNEEKAMTKIKAELGELTAEQKSAWENAHKAQLTATDEIISKAAKELADESAVKSIRSSLD